MKTMEYAYDAFSRQVLNRVQDANGVREYTRVWNGRQSIEEWENGQLSKSFIYGARLSERNGQPGNEMISSSPLGNPFLGCSRLWNSDIGSSFGLGSEYDPWTGQVTNPESGPGEPGCENDYSGGENPTSRPGLPGNSG